MLQLRHALPALETSASSSPVNQRPAALSSCLHVAPHPPPPLPRNSARVSDGIVRSSAAISRHLALCESTHCLGSTSCRKAVSSTSKTRCCSNASTSIPSFRCSSTPQREGNVFYFGAHDGGRRLQHMQPLLPRESVACAAAHSGPAMGYTDTQPYGPDTWDSQWQAVPLLEDAYSIDDYAQALEASLALESPAAEAHLFAPHPEALDPFSQLVYNHAVGRNLQWWRFLSYCRAQLHSKIFRRIPSINYSLVGTSYKKAVVLPSSSGTGRAVAGALTVPAFTLPLTQDPLSTVLDRLNGMTAEFVGYFAQMGNRYGASLLSLLVLGYWIQGFRCFPWMATLFYLKDGLQVEPATLQFWISTATLPMVAKPMYGIVSDVIYIGGERRMPYLMFAAALQVMAWSTVALHSGIRSSVGSFMAVLLVSNIGAAIAEVVNDALVAESVQKETGRTKGELQSFVWLALAIGGVLGNLTGGLALTSLSATSMFTVFAVLVAGHFLASSLVKEKTFNFKVQRPLVSSSSGVGKLASSGSAAAGAWKMVKLQAAKLVDLVSRPEIAMPLAWFAASYAMIPAVGGSLFFFQTRHLNIHPTYLGLAKVIGQMGLLTGSLMYNKYLKRSSPRRVLAAVQVLLSACMLADIVLVSRLNIKLGIPDKLYVLGASAFVEAIGQFKVLPFSVLLTQLCPAGSEGSLLAFFMACHCLAMILSGYMGTMLSSLLRISASNFGGLGWGILIQSLAALVPLFWISCIPDNSRKAVPAMMIV